MPLNPQNARPVRVVDESGNVINSFGGGGSSSSLGAVDSGVATIGTSVSVLRPAKSDRVLLSGQNLGPGVLYLNENATDPTATDDYYFEPGDSFAIESNEEVRALASVASTKVRWTER